MDLDALQYQVAQWGNRNFPEETATQALLGTMEELGELSHAHLKQEQGLRGSVADHHTAKIDAIGDILIFLARYCDLSAISLNDAVRDTWTKVKRRKREDWPTDG